MILPEYSASSVYMNLVVEFVRFNGYNLINRLKRDIEELLICNAMRIIPLL